MECAASQRRPETLASRHVVLLRNRIEHVIGGGRVDQYAVALIAGLAGRWLVKSGTQCGNACAAPRSSGRAAPRSSSASRATATASVSSTAPGAQVWRLRNREIARRKIACRKRRIGSALRIQLDGDRQSETGAEHAAQVHYTTRCCFSG